MSLTVKKEACSVCEKTVYPTEQVKADDKLYHRGCFRCEYCQGTLKLGSFASMDGRVFCKPHFKQLFNSKGNYSEGFGKLKPQQEFEAKKKGDGEVGGETPQPSSETTTTIEVITEIVVTPTTIVEEEEEEENKEREEEKQNEDAVTQTEDDSKESEEHAIEESSESNHHSDMTNGKEDGTASHEETAAVTKSSGSTLSVPQTHSGSSSSPDGSEKSTRRLTPTGSPKISVTQNKCCVCGLTVYDKEKVREDNAQGESFIFHKACFRCKVCNNVLKIGNFAALNSEFYCKPHFKQLFASKGNYSEGFGMMKPQHEFEAKKKNDSEKTDTTQ